MSDNVKVTGEVVQADRSSKARARGAAVITAAYAGYKWFEDHADDVEHYAQKAIDRSKKKSYGRIVVPTAHALIGAARWMQRQEGATSKLKKS